MTLTMHDLRHALRRDIDGQVWAFRGLESFVNARDTRDLSFARSRVYPLPVGELAVLEWRRYMDGEEVSARTGCVNDGILDRVA